MGCLKCGGPLDASPYFRKPRGMPADTGELAKRFSFCCRRDGCRKRHTPESVRFLGRKIYVAAAVAITTCLASGPSPSRLATIREAIGEPVSRQTIRRWQRWWLEAIALTAWWKEAKSRFNTPVAESDLPASLMERFSVRDPPRLDESLIRFLQFVAASQNPRAN